MKAAFYFASTVAIVLAAFVLPHAAFAETLASQPIATDLSNYNGYNSGNFKNFQWFNSIFGSARYIKMRIRNNDISPQQQMNLVILCTKDSGHTIPCDYDTFGTYNQGAISAAIVSQTESFYAPLGDSQIAIALHYANDVSKGIDMTSTRYYGFAWLASIAPTGHSIQTFGNIVQTYSLSTSQTWADSGNNLAGEAGIISEPFFELTTDASATSTQIIQVITPTAGTTTPSTSVHFQYQYFFDSASGASSTAAAVLQDLTNSSNVSLPSFEIIAQGTLSYNADQILTPNHYYIWTPMLRTTNNGTIFGVPQRFSVITDQNPNSSSFGDYFGQSTSTILESFGSSCDFSNIVVKETCALLAFLFVPSQGQLNSFSQVQNTLQTHAPFAYFYDVVNTWRGGTGSTTPAVAVLSFNMHNLGLGSTTPLGNILPNVTVLSTSTIMTYLPSSIYDFFMTLQGASYWLAYVYFVYRSALGFIKH